MQRVYDSKDASSNFSYFIDENVGHTLSPEMWERVARKFKVHL
jgi:hypothetical protein